MDWKLPATIIILIAIVSLGLLPSFSSTFSNSLTKFYSPIKDFLDRILHRQTEFNGGVVLSLSTNELSKLKIGIPAEIFFKLDENYDLKVDGKILKVTKSLTLKNFTGTIDFRNFTISGKVVGISSENFNLEGTSNIQINNKNFDELRISNLKIAELTITRGKIKTEKPRKIEAEIDDRAKLYGFSGTLTYKNNVLLYEGNCKKVQMKGFSLGE